MESDRRLEAEGRYVAGTMTLEALADDLGISRNTVKKWCKQYGWVKKRQRAMAKASKRAEGKAVTAHAKALRATMETLAELETAALCAARALRQAMEESPDGVVDGKFRSKNYLNVVEALERLAGVRMNVSGILAPADAQKIELLRRKQALEEKRADMEQNAGGAEIVVRMAPEVEEMFEGDNDHDAAAEPAAEADAQEP